jgi:hypothetical protein
MFRHYLSNSLFDVEFLLHKNPIVPPIKKGRRRTRQLIGYYECCPKIYGHLHVRFNKVQSNRVAARFKVLRQTFEANVMIRTGTFVITFNKLKPINFEILLTRPSLTTFLSVKS